MKAKAWLFEAAMEAGELQTAASGLEGVRRKTARTTRINLEATALLAICFIRQDRLTEAEPLIQHVFKSDKYIKSGRQRRAFRRAIKARFEREGALAILRGVGEELLDASEIQEEAGRLVSTKSEDQILADLGSKLPDQVVARLLDLDTIGRRSLPESEMKYLPKPSEITSDGAVGSTVLQSFSSVLYRSLCDPESDIYKAWFNEGFGVVLNKKYIATAIVVTMGHLGIGLKALAVSATALVIKFGVEVFCEKSRRVGVMDITAS